MTKILITGVLLMMTEHSAMGWVLWNALCVSSCCMIWKAFC